MQSEATKARRPNQESIPALSAYDLLWPLSAGCSYTHSKPSSRQRPQLGFWPLHLLRQLDPDGKGISVPTRDFRERQLVQAKATRRLLYAGGAISWSSDINGLLIGGAMLLYG